MKKRIGLWMVMCLLLTGLFGTVNLQAAPAPAISEKTVSLAKGQTITLSVKNTTRSATWSSSNKRVATVNKNGRVKAVKKGSATITAKIGNRQYKCAVTVSNKSTKTLIVYFSTTGTTQAAARQIQSLTGGTLVRLQAQKTYTSNYDRLIEIAQDELENEERPAYATTIKNWSQYDTVIIGYPIWWGEEPMVVRNFIEKQNWTGKTLLPFCTSGGSGISASMTEIRRSAENATVLSGRDLTDTGRAAIRRWLRNRKVI